GGQRSSVTSSPTGPHSGTLAVDGATVTYDGLEPIWFNAGDDVAVNGTDAPAGETLVVEADPDPAHAGNIRVRSTDGTFELVSFALPAQSLTITGNGGYDTVRISSSLVMHGANLSVSAESIVVDPGVTIDTGSGAISLLAADDENTT